jgi:hypothetical protein
MSCDDKMETVTVRNELRDDGRKLERKMESAHRSLETKVRSECASIREELHADLRNQTIAAASLLAGGLSVFVLMKTAHR